MNAARHVIGNGLAAVAIDADPNVTQPPDTRIVVLPEVSSGASVFWVGAEGGAPTLEVWFSALGDTVSPPLWLKVTTAAPLVPAAGTAVMLPPGVVPAGANLFLRVVAAGAAVRVLAGLTRG